MVAEEVAEAVAFEGSAFASTGSLPVARSPSILAVPELRFEVNVEDPLNAAVTAIVNTASIAGLVAGADIASYAVTKFGVVALSEHLYLELERAAAKTKVSVLCPGFVATKIMDAERNRPADRPDASPEPTDPQSEVFFEWFSDQIDKGLTSRSVGDRVLSAILEERFYILTHPDWNYMIEHRVRSMLDGQNPSPMPPPGIESLAEKMAHLSD